MNTHYVLHVIARKGSNGKIVDRREHHSTTPFGAFNAGQIYNWDKGLMFPIVNISHAIGLAFPGEPEEVQTHWITLILDTEQAI